MNAHTPNLSDGAVSVVPFPVMPAEEIAKSNVVAVDFQAARETADDVEEVAVNEVAAEPEAAAADSTDHWEPLTDIEGLTPDQLVDLYGAEDIHCEPGHGWFIRVTEPKTVVETDLIEATVDLAAFAAAISKAVKVVERRNTIPILSNAHLDGRDGVLSVTGTNLDIEVRVAVPYAGGNFGTTAPAHLLESIVGRRNGGDIGIRFEQKTITQGDHITREGESIALSHGRSSFNLQTLPESDFPDLTVGEFAHSFEFAVDSLCEAFRAVEFAISTEETRYYLNGVYLHTYTRLGKPVCRMVATDGHRLAHFDLKCEVPELPGVIVPRGAVALILSLLGKRPKAKKGETPTVDMVTVEISDTKIRFSCGDTVITSKLVDGTFPDYHRVIPAGNDKELRIDADALVDAIDSVTVISSDRGRAVKLSMDSGRLRLSVNNPDSGSASEEIDCEYQADGMEIGFNARYLLDILSKIAPTGKRAAGEDRTITMKLADPGSPTLFEGPVGPTCVLMPMRV